MYVKIHMYTSRLCIDMSRFVHATDAWGVCGPRSKIFSFVEL